MTSHPSPRQVLWLRRIPSGQAGHNRGGSCLHPQAARAHQASLGPEDRPEGHPGRPAARVSERRPLSDGQRDDQQDPPKPAHAHAVLMQCFTTWAAKGTARGRQSPGGVTRDGPKEGVWNNRKEQGPCSEPMEQEQCSMRGASEGSGCVGKGTERSDGTATSRKPTDDGCRRTPMRGNETENESGVK